MKQKSSVIVSVLFFLIMFFCVSPHSVEAGDPSVPGTDTTFWQNSNWTGSWSASVSANGTITDFKICNCMAGGSPHGSAGDSGRQGSVDRPTAPPPCLMTLNKPVIQVGSEESIVLDWSPTPKGRVTLSRRQNGVWSEVSIPVLDKATSKTDVVNLPIGTYRYNMRYDGYACSVQLEVVEKLTECNDKVDNADVEDTHADTRDPGCFLNADPTKPKEYQPLDTSEANVPPDLVPQLDTPSRGEVNTPVQFTYGAKNDSTTYAGNSALVYGWRNKSLASISLCRACFEAGGSVFRRTQRQVRTYSALQLFNWSGSFTPRVAGNYEVCVVVDYVKDNPSGDVYEGVSGELNNVLCKTIAVSVDPTVVVPVPTTPTGALLFDVSPKIVRMNETAILTWKLNGNTGCVITSGGRVLNGSIDVDSGTQTTPAIGGEATYTMTCDGGTSASVTVKVLPLISET